MTTVLSSIWNFFWGDAEKTELLRHLLEKGVPENEAAQATKICPHIQQNGQMILLLQSMIDNNASEREAVKALIKANGNPEQTIQLYNETIRRQAMLKEFTNMGISSAVAKQALENSNWDKKKARMSLEMQKKREMDHAKREYEVHKQVVQKLAASARKKKPTVHKAKLSHKQAKHARHRTTSTKSKKKKPVIDVDDGSDDDESHDLSTSDDEMEEAVGEEAKKHQEYHSSDDSDNEQQSPSQESPSSRRPATTAQKNKVFALRKNISVATCQSLAKAIRVLDKGSMFVAGVQELQKRPDFRTGSAAGYLQLLTESPSLRELVLKTLDETAANRS